jgi:chromate reductase
MELRICGIAGSLRRASFNRALLRAAQELAPADLRIEAFDRLGEIPLYNTDVEEQGIPEPVAALNQAIRSAHGLLVVTPEYNYGTPGVLKNAIDWASRPPRQSVLNGKPAAIIGASAGMWGTVRAQLALRSSFVFTNTPVMPQPEILVSRAAERFENGRLVDETTRKLLAEMLLKFGDWIRRFR